MAEYMVSKTAGIAARHRWLITAWAYMAIMNKYTGKNPLVKHAVQFLLLAQTVVG